MIIAFFFEKNGIKQSDIMDRTFSHTESVVLIVVDFSVT